MKKHIKKLQLLLMVSAMTMFIWACAKDAVPVFKETDIDAPSTEADANKDVVLYKGAPITRFLEMTRDDVIAEFGEPEDDESNAYYRDEGLSIYYDGEDNVAYACVSSMDCTINGSKLRIAVDEITGILFKITNRMDQNLIDKDPFYQPRLKYEMKGYTLQFILNNMDDKIASFVAVYSDDWDWDGIESKPSSTPTISPVDDSVDEPDVEDSVVDESSPDEDSNVGDSSDIVMYDLPEWLDILIPDYLAFTRGVTTDESMREVTPARSVFYSYDDWSWGDRIAYIELLLSMGFTVDYTNDSEYVVAYGDDYRLGVYTSDTLVIGIYDLSY